MAIKINSEELLELLEVLPADQNIMLMGKHGIGKSQILEHFFTKKGFKVVSLFLGQMSDPGDLIGLLHKNEITGKTEFMPPYWFPLDDKPIVLFLDELNRARPEVLQTIMDLALNKTLAGRKLPQGSRIISAVNNGDEYQLTALDPALVSRFNVYEFAPSVDEWLDWAKQSGLNNSVIKFISENPEYLDGEMLRKEDMDLEKSPDRRGWEKVANVMDTAGQKLNSDETFALYKKIVAGIIGVQTTVAFFEFLKKNQQMSASLLIEQKFDKSLEILKNYTTPQLAILTDSIFKYVESLKENNKKADLSNITEYFKFLRDNKKSEALGYFSANFTSESNKNASAIIAKSLPELANLVIEYISEL